MKQDKAARGSAMIEYVVVLAGLIAIWAGAELVLKLLREHQGEFTWTLSLPL